VKIFFRQSRRLCSESREKLAVKRQSLFQKEQFVVSKLRHCCLLPSSVLTVGENFLTIHLTVASIVQEEDVVKSMHEDVGDHVVRPYHSCESDDFKSWS